MPVTAVSDFVAKARRKYRAKKTQRSGIEQVWDEIDYYTGPVKEEGSSAQNQGISTGNIERKRDLWDHTAIDSREKLAASIHGSVTNPTTRWFRLGSRDPVMMRDSEVATWCHEETEGCWNDLIDSDFYVEIASAYHELCGPGHTFVAMEITEPVIDDDDKKGVKEDWDGVDFTCIPLREGFFEPDRRGKIMCFWRALYWTASEFADHCESRDIPLPEDVKQALDAGDNKKFEVVFHTFQRPKIMKRKKMRYPAVPEQRPYGYVYFRNDGDLCQLGDEGGYYEPPVFMCRWAKTPGSIWGHGPGNQALPTVKYVNGWKETLRAAGEKAVDPSTVSEERNLLSNPDLRPGGHTIVRSIDGIKTLESASKFDIGEGMMKEDQASIRHLFHTDELELKDSPAMTATEAQIRYEWMNRLLGKTLAFMQNDLLGPILMTLLAMRVRTGVAKPMPASLKKAGGVMNIEYMGPLARSQRADEVAAIERGATFVAGLAQFYPSIRAALDPLMAVKHVFGLLGVPAEVMPPDAVVRKAMAAIEDQMNKSMAADTAMKGAKAQKDTADAMQTQPQGQGPVQGAAYPVLPPTPPLTPSGAPYRSAA